MASTGSSEAGEAFTGQATLETAGEELGVSAFEALHLEELDAEVQRLSSELASLDLRTGQLALRFHRADGWRRLGYGSEAQYARERLGISRTTLKCRCALALRLERLPTLAAALAEGAFGVEAALLLVKVATPASEVAWVERARRRTVKQLREEVDAAGVVLRLTGRDDCWPPSNEDLADYFAIERRVLGGQTFLAQGAVAAPEAPPTEGPFAEASAADSAPAANDAASASAPNAKGGAAAEGAACAEANPTPSTTALPTPDQVRSEGGEGFSAPVGRSHWRQALGALLAWLGLGEPEGHVQACSQKASGRSDGSPATGGLPTSGPESVRISAGTLPGSATSCSEATWRAGRRARQRAKGRVRTRLRVSREVYERYRASPPTAVGWFARAWSFRIASCSASARSSDRVHRPAEPPHTPGCRRRVLEAGCDEGRMCCRDDLTAPSAAPRGGWGRWPAGRGGHSSSLPPAQPWGASSSSPARRLGLRRCAPFTRLPCCRARPAADW